MHPIKKICIIRLSSLGDIILSFPLAAKLKRKFPDAELHYVTRAKYKDAAGLQPSIDKILLLEDSLNDLRKKMKDEKYDLIIDIHKNLKSLYLKTFNARKTVAYKKDTIKKFLLVKFKLNLFERIIPVWERYLLAAEKLIGEYGDFETGTLKIENQKFVEGDYIVIAPSARHFTKTYPAVKFIEAVRKFREMSDLKIVLTGDGSERDTTICKIVESNCDGMMNLCGKLSIKELASVLAGSKAVFCNDSAVLHLAEAVGKRVTAVFGSTVKEFGFFPQLPGSAVMEVNELSCRPCTHFGRESCPLGHFKCMNEINLEIKL